jgi:hypothetical protein
MISSLALPIATLLLAFPSLKGVPGMGIFKNVRHRAAAIDSLPPAWRSASRLALEDQFVRAAMPRLGPHGTGLGIQNDPRRRHVDFAPDAGRLRFSTEAGTATLGPTASIPLEQYSHELTRSNFERLWLQTSLERLGTQSNSDIGATGTGSGLSFKFPSPLPRRMQSLLGPGGPALNVSGTENIRLSGTSQWSNQNLGLLGAHRSLFPSLDMQQDLDIRLEGQLSDRVKVNLLQNSAVQIPLANRIAINYKGDEDDLVQSLDLGNTNLTLPGTQYVSYSGRNEGLFGAKMTTRVGPLDWTVLASKQEGRSERASYSGGSSKQAVGIRDLDYIKGVYFFLYDPNRNPTQVIDESSIQLFLDNGSHVNPVGLVRGRAFLDPNVTTDSTRYVDGLFQPLKNGADQDYQVLTTVYGPEYPVIRLRVPITGEKQVLGVTYRYQSVPGGAFTQVGADSVAGAQGGLQLKMLRAPLDRLPSDPTTAQFDSTAPLYPIRDLELRNFYSLNGAKIDPGTFALSVHWADANPLRTSNFVNGESVPLIETLGLDNYDERNGFPGFGNFGHDGKVDGTAATSTARAFVDFEEGVLFFYELRPFAPHVGAAAGPFDQAIQAHLSRRNTLSGPANADSSNAPNPAVYDRRTTYPTDRVYTIDATFTAQRAGGTIMLGRTNLVEGSDVVTVNGQTLVRDRDYRVDYEVGQITMIRQLGASDQLNIDYAYAPLFAQAGKTLIGSAFRWDGKNRSFGGAFMYESKGAQDLRPRLGEEPSRLLIGDLNTDWRFHPSWVTRIVDRLPGVRTTAPSEFVFSAEVGGSMPNPNTKNEVYIDDMEGVKDAISLSMTSDRWHLSSVPSRVEASGRVVTVEDPSLATRRLNAETHWYTPVTGVHEKDLKPNLTQAQGANNTHNALSLSLPKRPAGATPLDSLWAGLTYVLDPVGLDITRSQFIEVWVNDFRDAYNPGAIRGRNVKLHIDIGAVSEDQQRAPNRVPNHELDSEDKNQDNQLNYAGGEDTGLDRLANADEPGPLGPLDLSTVVAGDPSGDDFARPNVNPEKVEYQDLDPRKWRNANGTQENHEVLPVPDTEDLNLNGILDLNENYFEYTIELGAESPYLVDSAYAPGRKYQDDKGDPVPEDNGWRRYRIPITDSLRVRFGSPDLALARNARVWLDGVVETDPPPVSATDGRPFIMLGGIDIVGSRWVLAPLDSTILRRGTTATLNALNTLDNADQYVPPFDPGTTRNGNQELNRREQSMVLEFENLQPADSIETYRTFSLDEDYSRYGAVDWFVTGHRIENYDPATDTLDYFVRFASDERGLNYYEVRAPVPMEPSGAIAWNEIHITLTDLSNLKLDPRFPRTGSIYFSVPGTHPGETWSIRGRPSFTRLRRISFGVVHRGPSSKVFPAGEVWFDELRAEDVARNSDHAQRVTFGGRAANLFNYGFSYDGRGADFQQVGEARGRGTEQSSITYTLQADLHRFFEATGIVLPVSYTFSNSKVIPRYTAGDDVFREGVAADLSTSHSISKTFSTSYTRAWSERSNPLLRYTVGGVSASYGRTTNENVGPSGADTTVGQSAAVSYSIAPRELVALKLPLLRSKFYLFPERFFSNYALTSTDSHTWQRLQDSLGTLVPSSLNSGRTSFIDFGASSRPFDFIHHEFTARRNLTLPASQLEHLGPVNLGRVVTWRQGMDTRLALQRMPSWLRPTFTWTSNFQQNNGPELSSDLSVRQIANAQNLSLSWMLPFGDLARKALHAPPPSQPVAPDSGRGDSTRARAPVTPRAPIISLRRLISRLGNISTEGRFLQTSSHNRVTGSPDPLYIIGVTTDPGFNGDSTGRVEPSFGNRSEVTTDYGGSARTQLDTGFGSNITTRAEAGWRRSDGNGVVSRSIRYRFPDFEVEYGRLPQILQIARLLRNPVLRTTYSRSQNTDYVNSETPTTISTSSEWRPLIGLEGDLHNGTRATLKIERRVTQRDDRLFVNTTATDRNTDVNVSLARRYSQGQKVKILGKESTIKTNVSLQVSGSYSKRSGETEQVGRSATSVSKTDRLSVNASGSYGFSNNVTGNLDIGFLQDRNLVLGLTNRSVRVEARAQFQF